MTNKQILINRLKSLGWRLGMMIAAALISFTLTNLELLNLNAQTTVILGLILGELSKMVNTMLSAEKQA